MINDVKMEISQPTPISVTFSRPIYDNSNYNAKIRISENSKTSEPVNYI